MQYLGGKFYAGKGIAQEIRLRAAGLDRWVEPFVGGAHVTHLAAPFFKALELSDINEDLILLRKQNGGCFSNANHP